MSYTFPYPYVRPVLVWAMRPGARTVRGAADPGYNDCVAPSHCAFTLTQAQAPWFAKKLIPTITEAYSTEAYSNQRKLIRLAYEYNLNSWLDVTQYQHAWLCYHRHPQYPRRCFSRISDQHRVSPPLDSSLPISFLSHWFCSLFGLTIGQT